MRVQETCGFLHSQMTNSDISSSQDFSGRFWKIRSLALRRVQYHQRFPFLPRSRSSFSMSAARTKSAMLISSRRAARSISRNMAFGMRAWIGVLSAAVNTLPRLRFRSWLVGTSVFR